MSILHSKQMQKLTTSHTATATTPSEPPSLCWPLWLHLSPDSALGPSQSMIKHNSGPSQSKIKHNSGGCDPIKRLNQIMPHLCPKSCKASCFTLSENQLNGLKLPSCAVNPPAALWPSSSHTWLPVSFPQAKHAATWGTAEPQPGVLFLQASAGLLLSISAPDWTSHGGPPTMAYASPYHWWPSDTPSTVTQFYSSAVYCLLIRIEASWRQGICLFCLLHQLQYPQEILTHGNHSINIYWINELKLTFL